jgi:AcrR family transcriptional regulator
MPRRKDLALVDRLLAAASDEFAERGYAGTSLARIGRRAGVTKGGVYFHFASKEALFFALLDHWRERLEAAVGFAAAANAASALRAFLAAYLAFHFAHPQAAALPRVLETELRGRFTAQAREDLRHGQRRLRARIRELLADGAQDGSLFAADPALAAFVVAGAVEGVLAQWQRSPRDVEPFCAPDALGDALVAPYRMAARAPAARRPAAVDDEDFRPAF